MIDEILFMETRVFSDFCRRKNMSGKDANKIFNQLESINIDSGKIKTEKDLLI